MHLNAAIEPKPLVVLDLNWLQGMPRGKELLPTGSRYVIVPRVLAELASRDDGRRAGDFGKLFRILARNRDHVFVSQQINVLVEDEWVARKPRGRQDIPDSRFSGLLREMLDSGGVEAAHSFAGELSRFLEHELGPRRERFWVTFVYAHKRSLWTPSVVSSDFKNEAKMRSVVQSDEAWVFWNEYVQLLEEESPSGTSCMTPTQLRGASPASMLERLVRALYYLRLKLVVGKTSEMDNDYDDIQYAITASVAGHLWTKDKGLVDLVKVCFPETEIRYEAA